MIKQRQFHRALLSLLFNAHLTAALYAQPRDIRFEHISVEQGLSNYAVTRIVQDHQGFLWIGTEDGLNKYDGYDFTVYKSDPADSTALSNRIIQALYVDHAGTLWIGVGDGLWQYHPDTDKFDRFKSDPRDRNSLFGKSISAIFEDRRGEFWIGTDQGLYRYNRAQDRFIIYRHDSTRTNSLSHDAIAALCEDRTGALWIGTAGGGVDRFEREKNSFVNFRADTKNPTGLSSDYILCLREDRRGVIWIGTAGGLNRYHRETNSITRCRYDPRDPHTVGPDVIFDIAEDSPGALWIGTFHHGLLRYEAATDRFFRYLPNPNDPYALSEARISCIYEDRSGVMWLGTYRHGLNRYNRRQDVFARYKTDDEIYAVCEDRRGNVWIGTSDAGLLKYDHQGRCLAQYRQAPQNPDSLTTNGIMAIHEDSRFPNDLWIGTSVWLHRYEARRRRFIRYPHVPVGRTTHHEQWVVKIVYEDAAGEIWIGTNGSGLYRWERGKKTFIPYRCDPENPQSLSHNSVWAICEDPTSRDVLWIGTFGGGVNRFDRVTQTFTRYQDDPNNPNDLNNGAVYSLYADPEGDVWIGTWGGGLNRLDPRTGRFEHYTERAGLPDNFVKSILPDDHGNLWLSTDKGLSRFTPKTGVFKNFTVKDGLLSNQFLSGAHFKAPDGELFFGGENGVIAFQPDSLKAHAYPPPVVITDFKVFGQSLSRRVPSSPSPVTDTPHIIVRLSYRQNFFSFEFVALDYTDPSKNQYAYKLEGFDQDWIPNGTRRYANYTNVNPGEYVFRAKGANSDGVWNETGASVHLYIAPPFWKTWWFRALATLLIGLSIYGGYRYRVNRLLEMERLRTRIAADLHDELASNLSSIAMFGKIVQDEASVTGASNLAHSEILQRIISLSQESVDSIREIIWAIDPNPETIHNLLLRVRDYAVNACRAQNIVFKFEMLPQEHLPQKNLSPEQRKHLWLLLKEAINNAIKHSGGTVLELRTLYESGHLTVSVIDNGAGMNGASPATRLTGKGLSTMKSRAGQLRGALEIFSHPEGGTAVVLSAKI